MDTVTLSLIDPNCSTMASAVFHLIYFLFSDGLLITTQWWHDTMEPGGRLNKKDGLTRCGDSHVKDKTS